VPFDEIKVGKHHGELIRLRGQVVDRAVRRAEDLGGQVPGHVITWLLQSPDATFPVEYEGAGEAPAPDLAPVGSTVEVEGVCLSAVNIAANETAPPIRLVSLKILLRSPAGLTVLARPSWFTPARLRTGIGLLVLGLVISGIWLLTVAKKNAALKQVIRELAQAQRELQEAHDTLEQKVEERSRQLQVEMTARKTAEVQFKAVLAERTRLARDLHDTLEQMLTGIALHLDATAKLAGRDPAASTQHLQKARNWLHQSQVDLRRSIWDLRSRELEQFDLASALRHTAEQLVSDSGATMAFHTRGEARRLPEVVEENILRIGQEALTNIAKHARATKLDITLDFRPQEVVLRIEDNGVGFNPAAPLHPETGHYGLIGMSERAKRMDSELTIDSRPGQGARLTVCVPLGGTTPSPPETPTPDQ
jgi:signal transduction histidine kinase